MKTGLAVCVAFAVASAPALAQDILEHSIVGSESCSKPGPCYSALMEKVPVQRFFLDLAHSPIVAADAETRLSGAGVSIDDLLALRLVRREGGRYVLNFPLFTASDVGLVRTRSEGYADSLAGAIVSRRMDLDRELAAYDAPGVDRGAVAFFLLGCVSLDWDGLEITARQHYRKVADRRPDGDYVPAAEEKTEENVKGIYWGSHNSAYGEVRFTSFGDHFSRRFAFPDLFWTVPLRLTGRSEDPEGATEALQALAGASVQHSAPYVGRIMLALRDGEKTSDEIAATAKLSPEDTASLLKALVALDYMREVGGRYRASIPVLSERDRVMADHVRAIGYEAMGRWLSESYPTIRADMKDLSFTHSGVPLEEGFTMIWHYIFGITNRKLVEAGLFADPYAPTRKYKGSIPAVYSLEFPTP